MHKIADFVRDSKTLSIFCKAKYEKCTDHVMVEIPSGCTKSQTDLPFMSLLQNLLKNKQFVDKVVSIVDKGHKNKST